MKFFGTSYPEDVKNHTKRENEHQTQNGRIITDSHLLIANRIYHIECQSTDDSTMVIRMIEYDFASQPGTCTEGKWQIWDVFSTVVRTVFARHKKERYDICGDCDARW